MEAMNSLVPSHACNEVSAVESSPNRIGVSKRLAQRDNMTIRSSWLPQVAHISFTLVVSETHAMVMSNIAIL